MEMRIDRDDTKITVSTIEMRTDHRDDNKITVSMLYEASRKGSVVTLKSSIEKDPLILSKILFTSLSETPLHISAALGHLDFTKELLKLKPNLASELDFHKRSPLHFAAAEGHVEIARALLHENKDVCSVKDQDGKIPLHHAATRGRIDMIQLLISTRRESVFEVLPSGETVLHLCVQQNHLEALRLLVEVSRENTEFLNAKEAENDDTILHLAIKLKQVETVEYLVSIPEVKQDTLNYKGYKASDLLDHLPRDFNTLRIQRLMGIKKKDDQKSWWDSMVDRLTHYKREWLKEMPKEIMVVAGVIATTTFQAAINPPGGVWQESPKFDASNIISATTTSPTESPSIQVTPCGALGGSPNNQPCGELKGSQNSYSSLVGTSVMAEIMPSGYNRFTMLNSVAFLASVSIIILMVGGFPAKNKICLFLLTMAICLTLTFMALTFVYGMFLVTPRSTGSPCAVDSSCARHVDTISDTAFLVFVGLFVLIAVYHTILFGIWLSKKLGGMMFSISPKGLIKWFCSPGTHF